MDLGTGDSLTGFEYDLGHRLIKGVDLIPVERIEPCTHGAECNGI